LAALVANKRIHMALQQQQWHQMASLLSHLCWAHTHDQRQTHIIIIIIAIEKKDAGLNGLYIRRIRDITSICNFINM